MTGILSDIIPAIGEVASAFLTTLGSVFEGVFKLIWATGENGGLTTLGWFLIVPISMALVYYGINFVTSLINKLRVRKN